MNRNSLVGIADVSIPSWRIQINDVAVFQKGDSRWIKMPSKQFEGNGTASYQPMVKWADDAVFERFRKAVFIALESAGHIAPKDTRERGKVMLYTPSYRPPDFPKVTNDDIIF